MAFSEDSDAVFSQQVLQKFADSRKAEAGLQSMQALGQ